MYQSNFCYIDYSIYVLFFLMVENLFFLSHFTIFLFNSYLQMFFQGFNIFMEMITYIFFNIIYLFQI